ncbi:DsbE family thiol:disulfide interchange protein [Aliiglaciecola lipolytica]|uniref:Thiol:disulfide interchange protein dsbE n=1 Tax=Aliiglaciecola lipolytica E3 TaxID=1127673 RepID=K6YC14_9ALTE|nr:DsbE family thiol:disulfide interchange protein [Aliiglaciecola lipolytica]GAC15742.1 thiol:disulfide interchange protein dsbE [Aliiglaciecola lipolytica E3]
MRKAYIFLIPLTLFVVLSVFLYKGLYGDPRQLDSTVLNKPAPDFSLPDLMQPDLTYDPQIFKGQVTLMNVWGVWCVTCAVELPYLTELSQQGVRIIGLYYDQDTDPDFGIKSIPTIQKEVTAKLAQLGNPYEFNIFDVKRDYSLDLGVTGAPETFLIDKQGIIRMHHIGDINTRVWRNKIAPLYNELMAQ